jgi:hypothetical protein
MEHPRQIHRFPVLAAVALAVVLGGCGGGGANKPFVLLNDARAPRPGTIAVIAGNNYTIDTRLAEYLTDELKKRSSFRVISQDDIGEQIVNYPSPIDLKPPAQKPDAKPIWFDPPEKARLDSIHEKLKATYLFVIWGDEFSATTVTHSRGGSSTTYFVTALGNLLEYPGGHAVASTELSGSNGTSFLAIFHRKNYYIEEMLEDVAARIVDKMLELTKANK